MMLQMLKSKIQGIIVTESQIGYPGSISLPNEVLESAGIREFELVHVNNKTNGKRIITYAVRNKNKGQVTINGAASWHFEKGDIVHVLAFAHINEHEIDSFCPRLVVTDKANQVTESKPYVFERVKDACY